MNYPSFVNHQIAKVIEDRATAASISKLAAAELVRKEFIAEGLVYSAGQAERYMSSVKARTKEVEVAN